MIQQHTNETAIGRREYLAHLSIAHVLIYYFIIATLVSFVVPPWEGPDEPNHLDYINFVSRHSVLPDVLHSVIDGRRVVEAHQPPLYYLIAALLNRIINTDGSVDIKPVHNKKHAWFGGKTVDVPPFIHMTSHIFSNKADMLTFYLMRMLSVMAGLVTLVYVFRIAGIFLPDKNLVVFPVLFVATLPELLYISAVINNDSLAVMFSTMCLYYCFSIVSNPNQRGSYILIGVCLALALVTKKSVLFLLPGIVVVFCYLSVTNRPAARQIWIRMLPPAMLVAAVFCMNLARNYLQYGELLGLKAHMESLPGMVVKKSLISWYFVDFFMPRFFMSFVGTFGWNHFKLPSIVYLFYFVLFIVWFIGLLWCLKQSRFKDPKINLSLLFVALSFSGIVYYNLTFNQPSGRFLFPVVSLIAVQLTLGLEAAFVGISESLKRIVINLIAIGFVLCDLVTIVRIHNFYYRLEQYLFN